MPVRHITRLSAATATATLLGAGMVGLTAVPAYAADVTDSASLNAAIVADDPVITIASDFTLTADIDTIDHDVEIIGNGHTIDADGYEAFNFFDVSVTISDITVVDSDNEAFHLVFGQNDGAVLEGVSSADGLCGIRAVLDEGASLDVTGGSHENNSWCGIHVVDDFGDGEVSITGTTIEDAPDGIYLSGFHGVSTASIADVTITDAGDGIEFYADNFASLEVTGTDVIAGSDYNDGGNGWGLYTELHSEASVTFDGGSVTGETDGAYFEYGIETYQYDGASVVISDSEITGNRYNIYTGVDDSEGSFSLLGGSVIGAEYYGVYFSDLVGTGVVADTLIDGNGFDEGYQGAYVNAYEGGSLTFSNTTISNSGGNGIFGNLFHDGTSIAIIDSTIADNGDVGVELEFTDASELTIDSSTLSGNVDGGLWAWLYGDSSVTVVNSTVSGNTAGEEDGWALWAGGFDDAFFELLNSTVTDNTGIVGVGYEYVTAVVSHSVVAGNHIDEAGGYGEFWVNSDDFVDVTVDWSLIGGLADDSAGAGYSEGDGVATGVTDPGLGPLADNGGPTLTHLLTSSSPALNKGNPLVTGEPEFDQRGFTRVSGSAIDIGAVEREPILPATGAESTGAVLAGGLLLMFGASVLLAARALRRRTV